MVMAFSPVGKGKRDLEDMVSGKGDDAAGTKADDPNSNKSEKADDAVKPKGGAEADAPAKGKDGEAYEDGGNPSIKTRAQKVAESQAAFDRANAAYDSLPQSKSEKTVASDGIKTVSGWSPHRVSKKFRTGEGVTDVPSDKVLKYGKNDLGHEFNTNSSIDHGVEGQASASHAEKQMMTDNPKDPIGVSRDMCPNCKSMAQKHASHIGEDYVVTDPEGTYIFEPGGSEPIFIPR